MFVISSLPSLSRSVGQGGIFGRLGLRRSLLTQRWHVVLLLFESVLEASLHLLSNKNVLLDFVQSVAHNGLLMSKLVPVLKFGLLQSIPKMLSWLTLSQLLTVFVTLSRMGLADMSTKLLWLLKRAFAEAAIVACLRTVALDVLSYLGELFNCMWLLTQIWRL